MWIENEGDPSSTPNEPTLAYIREVDQTGRADHRLVWIEDDFIAFEVALPP